MCEIKITNTGRERSKQYRFCVIVTLGQQNIVFAFEVKSDKSGINPGK